MKERVESLLKDSLEEFHVYVEDAFIEEEEGQKVFHIVLDSDEVIDLNRITEASRKINEIMDQNESILEGIDVLDIYSKEKGEE